MAMLGRELSPMAAAAAGRLQLAGANGTTPTLTNGGSTMIAPVTPPAIQPVAHSASAEAYHPASTLATTGDFLSSILPTQQDSSYADSMAKQSAIVQAAQDRATAAQQQVTEQPYITGTQPVSGQATSVSGNYTVPNVSGGLTPQGFADALLKGLGDKVTPGREAALEAWEAQEGGNWHNDASYNPLNTTEAMPGYHEVGTQGNIGAYTDWKQGLEATLKTLENGRYAQILQALRNGQSTGAVEAAISASPWGTHF